MRLLTQEQFQELVWPMKPGQRIKFDRHQITDAFGPERLPFFIEGRGSVYDRIMSSLIGSMHGEWLVSQDVLTGDWTIDRREPPNDDRIYYVDPDRRDYYDKLDDGTYRRNDVPFVRRETRA